MKTLGLLLMLALSGCRLPPPQGANPPRTCAGLPYNIPVSGCREKLDRDDAIRISGVRGDRPTLAVGGQYCVWGRYLLTTRADATLSVSGGDRDMRCVAGRPEGAFAFRFSVEDPAAIQRVSLRGTDGREFGWSEFTNAAR
jgi:hypothetical protein